ncbi:S8 family serine peptidase [Xanthobacter sp. V4C-4]|uniref:S8 family serine peptidase n=1 Tax=Xanthobacter cornucopiae TaxID=3119924 RepID=UPI00372898D5
MNTQNVPTHIVVFADEADDHEQLLADAMGIKSAQEVPAGTEAGTRLLKAERKTSSRVRPDGIVEMELYAGLGVAGADLAPTQAASLRRNDRVIQVVENTYRSRPRPTVRKLLGPQGLELPPAPAMPLPTDPLAAYILGMKAALDNIARAVAQQGPPFNPAMAANLAVAANGGGELGWPLTMMGLNGAPAEPTGKGIRVALLDTGIDVDHPDLAAKVDLTETTKCFVPNETVDDSDGHGTHCAGVIAGPHTPTSGPRFGVAPDAELLVGKVLGPTGGFDTWILRGLAWAVAQRARVVSLSLGSVPDPNGYPSQYETAATRALAQGTIVVAASGNDSARPTHVRPVTVPANCPSIFAVGAVGRGGRIAAFSNERVNAHPGAEIDFVAPGVEVLSTYLNGSYALLSGTSMATPHVAGLAALYMEAFPHLNAAAIVSHMKSRSSPIAPQETYGSGLVRL